MTVRFIIIMIMIQNSTLKSHFLLCAVYNNPVEQLAAGERGRNTGEQEDEG
jgi:hypothetical protein